MSGTVVDFPEAVSPADAALESLSEKQQQIYAYLRDAVPDQTYFKSREIAEGTGLSTREVGSNITALLEADLDITIEKWGYTSSTTWMVTEAESE